MINSSWIWIAIIITSIIIYLGILHTIKKKLSINPEWIRKALHVGGGCISLLFPLIFKEIWPVWVISITTFTLLLLLRIFSLLSEGIGHVLKGIGRQSMGELYFPISIALLWTLALGQPLLYVIPLMILTFADSAAAMVGIYYGLIKYKATESIKSTEGSFAFFLVAFFSTHVPLLLFSKIDPLNSLLTALLIGFLLMIFEAIAWNGFDNLFIPLFGFFILKLAIEMPTNLLYWHLGIVSIFMIIVFVARIKSSLSDSALLSCALFAYFCWVMAGVLWVIVPIFILIGYRFITPKTRKDSFRLHNIQVIGSIIIPGLIWIIIYKLFQTETLFFPYLASFSSQLALISFARFKRVYKTISTIFLLTATSLLGLLYFTFYWITMSPITNLYFMVFSSIGIFCSVFLFSITQPNLDGYPLEALRWVRQSICGALASVITALPLIFPFIAKKMEYIL